MASDLKTEIKQKRPFESPAHEAWVSIQRTASVLSHAFEQTLKPFGITPTQFNVLRILRGAGPDGLCRNEVRDRLVAQVPDTSRLLDRTEQLGLVARVRSAEDRRYVMTRITKKGLALLDQVDSVVGDLIVELLGHMSRDEHRDVSRLLGRVRESRNTSTSTTT